MNELFVSILGDVNIPTYECDITILKNKEKKNIPSVLTGFLEPAGLIPAYAMLQLKPRIADIAPVGMALLRDCYVLPSGVILTGDRKVIVESIYPMSVTEFSDRIHVPDQEAISDIKEQRRDKIVELDQAIHCREIGEGGYYHWLTAVMPRMNLARTIIPDASIPYLVEAWKEFAADWLAFAFPDFRVQRSAGRALFVRRLHYPLPAQIGSSHFTRNKYLIEIFRENVLAKLRRHAETDSQVIKRAYISRNDAPMRKIANENYVMNLLEKLDFQNIRLDGMSVPQQIRLFCDAEIIIGPHGAGLSNIIFSDKKSSLIEILGVQRVWPTHRVLTSFSGAFYAPYVASYYDAGQTPERGIGNEDIKIDADCLAQFVSAVLGREP
ncbi:DUF563 domain-containing protein [Roseomonas sp. CECT 9278]|uniref:glycosyltransferase family 61 protein n=1 Tax=Roseomonas sp. CECT 9278 TaxID=2845823 RepID=UPI001E468AE2|nr:glycosyltransferase family 61 protein [Roseomonas sp. CECT 9278]CAH0180183.1 hypothetical protein ROS9278_01421 [Roseomonas sp. CECT 9278]